ncbi:hypothetical protein R3P38DRAFT_3192526 [Favolaschia claudopus]|uniref:Uncharacterized protein n=1 Tax=Favolaschia claudopus TaxID=2862362 RepID=A0AAW0BI26_9AGAR
MHLQMPSQSTQPPHYAPYTRPTPTSTPRYNNPTYQPPPPYTSSRFVAGSSSSKKSSSGRWNIFSSRKTSSAVNPRGLQAEMIDPEDRAWS